MCRAGLGVKVVKGGFGVVAVVSVPLVGLLGIVVVVFVEAASGAVSLFRRGLMIVASGIVTLSIYVWALKCGRATIQVKESLSLEDGAIVRKAMMP